MSCMSQNFRLFHVSNLSVRNFRIFLLMYTGSMMSGDWPHGSVHYTLTRDRPGPRRPAPRGGDRSAAVIKLYQTAASVGTARAAWVKGLRLPVAVTAKPRSW